MIGVHLGVHKSDNPLHSSRIFLCESRWDHRSRGCHISESGRVVVEVSGSMTRPVYRVLPAGGRVRVTDKPAAVLTDEDVGLESA